MKAESKQAEFSSEAFRLYDGLLRQLHRLERRGGGDGEEADALRDAMDVHHRNLSPGEIVYFKQLSASLYDASSAALQRGKDVLSSGVVVKGSMKVYSNLLFDGDFEGDINSDAVLTLGENAHVRGEIKAQAVVIYGKVEGLIAAGERCELKAQCVLHADVKAARLVIEEGATFIGSSEVVRRAVGAKYSIPAEAEKPAARATAVA